MRALIARLSKIERLLIGIFAGLALGLAFLVMTTRYLIPDLAFGWLEQPVIFLLIWALWLSASQLVEKQEHIHNDLILRRLSGPARRAMKFMISALGLIFCIALCWGSFAVVHFAWMSGETSEGITPVPLTLYYLSMAVGTLLMSSKYLLIITKIWYGRT